MPKKPTQKRQKPLPSGGPKSPNSTTVGVHLTMPVEVRDQLDILARRLKITRSAVASGMLSQALTPIMSVISELPSTCPTELDVKRMRGRSVDVITDLLSDVNEIVDSLGKGNDDD